jgi:hypothetical protein
LDQTQAKPRVSELKSEYEAKVAELKSSVKDIACVIKQSDRKAFATEHQRVETLSKQAR